MKKNGFMVVLIAIVGAMVAACVPAESADTPKVTESQKAQQAANSIKFTENAEIENIKKRLELTSNPGLIGYVVLMNQTGQPILYTAVKGKITSGGKRLTAPEQKWNVDCGQYCNEEIGPAPSDEGTWGHSGEYIYFWDTNGAYHQWNGAYFYSDQPIRLSVKPLVIAIGEK